MPAVDPPTDVLSLLHQFLSLQSRRSSAYSEFRSGFRRFLDTREAWEAEEQAETEKRSKESTTLVKEATNNNSSNSSSSTDAVDGVPSVSAEDRATLAAIEAGNAADRRRANPEIIFQQLCARTMTEFQSVSADVRAVIASLSGYGSSSGSRFATLLSSLQQLEKLKLEVTIHQQMLHNQQYVLAHPRAHGQLQEHSHHVHSVTDKHGRVREHPSHHGHAHQHGGLTSVGEDEDEADAQELRDNGQPFTRHLSALLSETAFQTDSPFLFPPSGAAPITHTHAAHDAETDAHTPTLQPHISAEVQEKYESEVHALRLQEIDVVEQINEIIEEIRIETIDQQEGEDEDEDAEDKANDTAQ